MSTADGNLTGYGPRLNLRRLHFDGDEEKYDLWEVKFIAHLRLQKLNILDEDNPDAEKNADVFAELVQVLDDKSLQLVMREAKDNGKKAIKILREHYRGISKPRIISLYTELTSLKMHDNESVTDYILRAEKYTVLLHSMGEEVRDGLLIAMILKGLPVEFKSFNTVILQKEKELSFAQFRTLIKAFEENEKSRTDYEKSTSSDKVLKTKAELSKSNNKLDSGQAKTFTCFKCGKPGHKSFQCYTNKNKKWCIKCKASSHNTEECRKMNKNKNDSINTLNENNDEKDMNYCFKVNSDVNEENTKCNNLLVDCGATIHIVHDKSKFVKFDKNFDGSKHVIELADGKRHLDIVKGKGDAVISMLDNKGINRDVTMKNALYIPSFKQNIFSVKAAVSNGAQLKFTPEYCVLSKNNVSFNISENKNLYYLNNVSVKAHSLEEWHNILGHCNINDILKLENHANGMIIKGKEKFDCKTCFEGKMTRTRNRISDEKADKNMELIHCDLAGPMSIPSREGSKYAISFVDDCSGVVFVYFLKNKNDATEATKKFLADTATYGKIKRFRCDNGGEFTSNEFKKMLVENQIKQEFSAPYSPHQNGTAERMWRTLFEMARCLLFQANLPKVMWNYAIRVAAYTRNRCYNPRINMTPFEKLTSKKPNLQNLHIFGSQCFSYIEDKKKLDPRCKEGIFVGYDVSSPAYLIYYPEEDQLRKVRNVKFTEKIINKTDEKKLDMKEPDEEYFISQPIKEKEQPVPETQPNERRYPERQRKAPNYLDDYIDPESVDTLGNFVHHAYRISDSPSNYFEAVSSSNSQEWKNAMDEEMRSLQENNTYELTTLPEGQYPIGGKWIFTIKEDKFHNDKHKARYVAKGFSQVKEFNYSETFSPTVRMNSIRTLIQYSIQNDMIIHTMDFKSAYLNANIDFDIYIEQPEGYVVTDNKDKLYWKLNKSLYGLKQSGRNWNNLLHEFLINSNFKQSLNDNCIYIKDDDNHKIVLIVFVDDLIISSNNAKSLDEFKSLLCKSFRMKDLGLISNFLGINFEVKDNCIKMNQSNFVDKIVKKFNLENSNPKSLPCSIGSNFNNNVKSPELTEVNLFRKMLGSLIYLMTCTRPDLSYVISKLSQYMAKPTNEHLNMCKNVIKYIKGTSNYSLVYKKSTNELDIQGYCDSDWGGLENRHSMSGYLFYLDVNSSPISWKSKKQKTVALSTCEAEYIALSYALQEAKYLNKLYFDLTQINLAPINVLVDNQGAIQLAKNPIYHERSKHIDIRYHFIRNCISNGEIKLTYVESKENKADMFTKPVSKQTLKKFNVCS